MRGETNPQSSLITLIDPESLIPKAHPLRRIKALVDQALREMCITLEAAYARNGRRSVPPEQLLKGQLLIALYSIRSERQLCEQLHYNFLFRWFLDMDFHSPVFNHSTFSKNRERFLKLDIARELLGEVVEHARDENLLSDEHFSVDGTLIESLAGLKSLRRRDGEPPRRDDDDPGNPSIDFRGEKRKNDTHVSKTDPEARLARKGPGKEAKLSFSFHALMENRHGFILDAMGLLATGTAEREAGLEMLRRLDERKSRVTLGADKGYDTKDFVKGCRELGATPHVAAKKKGSALDGRTTRTKGYALSQRARKRIEEAFGYLKDIAGERKSRFVGLARVEASALVGIVAYNLTMLARILGPPGGMGERFVEMA